MAPLAERVFAPELVLKVATCIVERHSGYGLSVDAGNGDASATNSGQQTKATVGTLSEPVSGEETPPRESAERSSASPTSMGVDIMLDTALSRLEQQIQDAGRVDLYAGPGLRAKPRSVKLGSHRGAKARAESESCFG